mgnify:CR=1 FL=1
MSDAYKCDQCRAYFDKRPNRYINLPLPFTYTPEKLQRTLVLSVSYEGLDFCKACLLSFASQAYEKFTKQLAPAGATPDIITFKPARSHRRKEKP